MQIGFPACLLRCLMVSRSYFLAYFCERARGKSLGTITAAVLDV